MGCCPQCGKHTLHGDGNFDIFCSKKCIKVNSQVTFIMDTDLTYTIHSMENVKNG